ncbi:MAG: helix-turn-helix transcriptional regulator [Ruminococcaceae bacterium]|nr:helix-turn-helix transcriptional regulator [Oscillospiraceae bacterium]
MNEQVKQIASRIKELREIMDMEPAELAEKLGISLAQYHSYEDGLDDIPISIIYGISGALGVDSTVILTGSDARMAEYTVVRAGQGHEIERYPGYAFSSLAINFKGRVMDPMIVSLGADKEPSELVSHKGQEFNYVTKGVVIVTLGKREFVLNVGDSIYFDPTIPHGQRAGGVDSEFLTVIHD